MFLRLNLHIILACLVGTSVLFFVVDRPVNATQSTQSALGWREEIRQIDQEIKTSEELRDRHLAIARRAEDQGMRWQFTQNQKQEAKRAFQKADANKKEAALLQEQIDLLNKRKAQLLKDHPETNESKRSP